VRTLIAARYVVGYQDGGHRLLDDGEVVVDGDRIAFVGRGYAGPVDERIDARDRLLIPGFITVHSHLTNSPLTKSFLEDCGNPFHYMSGLYEYLAVTETTPEDGAIAAAFSLVEMLKSGITTVVQFGNLIPDRIVALAGELGVRAYVVPAYRSGRWHTPDGRRVEYEWAVDEGLPGLAQAVDFIRRHDGAHEGRIKSFLGPAQIDTCTPALLRRTAETASALDVPVTIHAGQATIEFQEITRRYGRTPIEHLHHVGLLDRRLIIAHCIFISGHPMVTFPGDRDLELLAASGAHVAHCPWVFGRRGIVMQSYARYRRAGVNVALGTDTFPQDMIHEMRQAAVLSKVAEADPRVATAADVFTSATLGGARALGRDDLGRIAPGAKADLVLVRLDSLTMAPVRDPIKNLVFSATAHDVDTVMVNGKVVVRGGAVAGVDERRLARDLQAAAARLWERTRATDWARRAVDEISPPSFPPWREGAGSS
jgi:cytosine/adenosine deaminase-related metal-dependent hydrolase